MKIAIAQLQSVKGDITQNKEKHLRFVALAAEKQADFLVFPELSLTNYEPLLAKSLAVESDDASLGEFQELSNLHRMTIGVGMPTRSAAGVHISLVLFRPYQTRLVYSKKYLHADEEPFFVSGENFTTIEVKEEAVALAICYELSVAEHTECAINSGAKIYVASVAKTAAGMEKSVEILSKLAQEHSMTVLIANCVGPCEDFVGIGKSAAWSPEGLLKQLDDETEGVLVVDTKTHEVDVRINS